MNLDYMYDHQKQHFMVNWEREFEKREVSFSIHSNAIVLPCRKGVNLFGQGGVIDENTHPLESSFIHVESRLFFGGSYKFDDKNIDFIDDEIIYLGYINNHWGHFLMNFSTRLWYIIYHCQEKKSSYKFLYIINENSELILHDNIVRFFELLGINQNQICFVNKVCKVRSLIIPMESYVPGRYYSDAYKSIFSYVTRKVLDEKRYKRTELTNNRINVYFSRRLFCKTSKKDIGVDIIDDLFNANNYTIVYPEQESLDNQIFYVANSSVFACISGTIVHNLLFRISSGLSVYVFNKLNMYERMILDTFKIMGIDPIFIDSYVMKYPVRVGYGPFLITDTNCLQRFIKDFSLKTFDKYYISRDYKLKIFNQYANRFLKTCVLEHRILTCSDKISFPNFFSIQFINQYLTECIQYENKLSLIDKYIDRDIVIASNFSNLLDSYKHLWFSIFNRPMIDYKVHCSNIGWLDCVPENVVAGFTNYYFPIEALSINSNISLSYKCCYKSNVWSNLVLSDGICGSVGEGRPIFGISIMVTPPINDFSVFYRVFFANNTWSDWKLDGFCLSSEDYPILALQILLQKHLCS